MREEEAVTNFLWWLEHAAEHLERKRIQGALHREPNASWTVDSLLHIATTVPTRRAELRVRWEAQPHPPAPALSRTSLQRISRQQLPEGFPLALRMRGRAEALMPARVAVIGARHPTLYGREQAHRFGAELARAGICVLSGGAIGVDTCALEGALRAGGCAAAVLGSGMALPHPASNRTLFQDLAESDNGVVLSEFPDGLPASRWAFPQRNFTIAALADFVLIIEARGTSGSLITARFAYELNRDLGALPGAVDSELSVGTNSLLQEGCFCITRPTDVLERVHSLLSVQSRGSQEEAKAQNGCDERIRAKIRIEPAVGVEFRSLEHETPASER